jgi:intracellular sulfur oxidation DsrE/DsrF family protein
MRPEQPRLPRRSFLSRFGAGMAAFGAALGAGAASPQAQSPAGSRPASSVAAPPRHAIDDWFDAPSARHRMYFDTTTPEACGQAMFFANNVFTASRSAYSLADAETAVILAVRHRSTAFGYDDEMWKKYGAALAERAQFKLPKSGTVPTTNVYLASGAAEGLLNASVTWGALSERGVRLAVCQMATRANAGLIAQKTGAKADDIYQELAAHLVPNAHLVPAGIVALSRAQERGYTFAYVE